MVCTVIISMILSAAMCQNDNATESHTEAVSEVTTVKTTTTAKPPDNTTSCEAHHKDCKGCVANSKCYYCDTDAKCYYKVTDILTNDKCDMKEIHYLTCKVNAKYLLIGISVAAGLFVLAVTIVCCYCCCKKRGVKISKDDLKWARQKEERKQIAAERRKERAERTEEIRKKYGMFLQFSIL
ncbi:uncharacterized protein CEXT_585091 [Caerostris extrusa]|uniref:PTTG1IP n=1 Tax=Caerostris extrusa TaxID=172846 RepID=A0AAV4PDH8_CAEEX|nr:uncharacterized protein CEXT_585091 [Caerostris extrusa]